MDMGSDNEEQGLMMDTPATKRPTPWIMYYCVGLSAVGGLLFGYDTGVVSGAMVFIAKAFNLSSLWFELIVSITILFAWLFSLVAGYMSDRLGRKKVVLLASFVFAGGAMVMAAAQEKYMLLVGRMIVGAAIGLASMVVPVYIAEVAPMEIRGTLVSVNQLMITFGFLLASLIAGGFSKSIDVGWRYMLGLGAIPAVLQLVGFFFLPESPRWLVRRGRIQEGSRALKRIRGPQADIEEELEGIRESCLQQEREQNESGLSIIPRILADRSLRKALLIGCALQMFQQLAGVNTVMYYGATIIKMSGIHDDSQAVWMAAGPPTVNFFCTFIALYLVERVGRRPLTLSSLAGVIVSLLVLAIGFQLSAVHSPHVDWKDSSAGSCMDLQTCLDCTSTKVLCGFCYNKDGVANGTCSAAATADAKNSIGGPCSNLTARPDLIWAKDWCPSTYSWMTLMGLGLYLLFFAPGMGPMPWTINSEIYPLWARSTCYSIATAVNWFANLIIALSFLSLTEAITTYGAFYFYAGLASLGWLIFMFFLPETRGKSLEDTDDLFSPDATSIAAINTKASSVKYVHIRGMNQTKMEEQDSMDES